MEGKPFTSFIIRLLDLIFSAIGLIITSPIILIVTIILLLTGEHKVFYLQERVGKGGKPFKIIKFVTMRSGSEKQGNITLKNDPRVLPFGKFLRKTKINELPQLINVLKGDMSLVGWRAQTYDIFSHFTPDVQQALKKIRPGVSGIGPVMFRSEEELLDPKKVPDPRKFYLEVLTPYKGYVEKWYVDNYSIKNYLLIIFCTILIVLFPKSTLHMKLFKNVPTPPQEILKIKALANVSDE